MDVSDLFKGQTLEGECTECHTPFQVDASIALSRTNNEIPCSGCGKTLVFNNADAVNKIEDGLQDLQKSFSKKIKLKG